MLSNSTVPLSVTFTSPEDFFIFIFHILFATSAVLLAGSVVIGIFSTKSLRQQNRFIFMLNTSISDTLTGFSVYYLGLFDVQEGYPSRNGTYYILPSFLGVNVLTFLFAQFDRYFAVCHPFFYNRFISRSFVIGVCAFCWIYTYSILTVQNMVPIYLAAQINAFGVMTLQIIVITKLLMTIKLYFIARNQLGREVPSAERDNKKESLRIIVFVVICFLTLWSPSFVNIIVRQLTKGGLRFRNEATNLFAIMARFNALVTPALYIWGSPALRATVWKTMWRSVCPCRRRRRTAGLQEFLFGRIVHYWQLFCSSGVRWSIRRVLRLSWANRCVDEMPSITAKNSAGGLHQIRPSGTERRWYNRQYGSKASTHQQFSWAMTIG
ncbi:C5a anaphylatoxin chemotactic receptor 1-like [Hypomesus transpacificus]|uniref:C5a anaphylatoxin chemotactic receptor 1-like n=1 Tax=Hypomesus transpacificus TaxID=137520 RepID=UPI001F081EB9|nr:C5a anaphylatoxin chemotactic receptor 1-like [Hypomesus transpacificus]